MLFRNFSRLAALFVIFMLVAPSVWANLMIAPHRVIFEPKQRSVSINLLNTSTTTNTYRLHWVQKKQAANGKMANLPADSNEVPNASTMLRFSPRQVTLAPGEKQTIRISHRRKNNLKIGEHRSYLLFQALPNEDEITKNSKKGLKINLLLGFAIPIIIREGKLSASAKISDLELSKTIDKEKTHYGAHVTVNRSGPHTTIGSIKLLWKPTKSNQYRQVGILNNLSIYPERSSVKFYIGLTDFKMSSGSMKVIYEGQKEFEEIVFDTIEKNISKDDFQLLSIDDI